MTLSFDVYVDVDFDVYFGVDVAGFFGVEDYGCNGYPSEISVCVCVSFYLIQLKNKQIL